MTLVGQEMDDVSGVSDVVGDSGLSFVESGLSFQESVESVFEVF